MALTEREIQIYIAGIFTGSHLMEQAFPSNPITNVLFIAVGSIVSRAIIFAHQGIPGASDSEIQAMLRFIRDSDPSTSEHRFIDALVKKLNVANSELAKMRESVSKEMGTVKANATPEDDLN